MPPDYDSDPDRRRSWVAPRDWHDIVGPELRGPVLDIGCGEGRLRRHNGIPAERAETAELPLWLTKRAVLVRATKD